MVGPSGGVKRQVCRCVFLAHYPQSRSTLNRIINNKRGACGTDQAALDINAQTRSKQPLEKNLMAKTAHVITWWLRYAEETSENFLTSTIF
eukprot:3873877-Pleurochrysis_carterae.AAC.1